MAVAKPAFTRPVEPYRTWNVVEVIPQIAGVSAVLSQPLQYWGGTTPNSQVYSLPTTEITTSYLMSLFQKLLSGGGNYTLTTGVALYGTTPLTNQQPVNLTFLVRIRDRKSMAASFPRLTATQRETSGGDMATASDPNPQSQDS